jgi:hypothetical protein
MTWKGLVLAGLIVVIGGCATTTVDVASTIPEIPVTIVPAATDLAPELAAFLGVWEGTWIGYLGTLPARFTVWRIDAKSAEVIYAWGDEKGLSPYSKAGFVRREATVLPGGRLEWKSGEWTFRFEISRDRTSVTGQRIGRWSDSLTMKKVSGPAK